MNVNGKDYPMYYGKIWKIKTRGVGQPPTRHVDRYIECSHPFPKNRRPLALRKTAPEFSRSDSPWPARTPRARYSQPSPGVCWWVRPTPNRWFTYEKWRFTYEKWWKMVIYLWKMVKNGDLPMKNGDFPWFFVCLPVVSGFHVSTNPTEKYESVGMIIPNIWKNKSHVWNHQPV